MASGSTAPTVPTPSSTRRPSRSSAQAPEASVDQALDAARAAQEAFPSGPRTPAAERARLLRAVADRSAGGQGDLVPLIISETGATATVGSRMQVPVAIERFERYATAALGDLDIPLAAVADADDAAGRRWPDRGLVPASRSASWPCISPYNFPVVNIAGKIAPALAVGCTVVIKPAPQDPLAVIELVEIMHEVGFPPGVVNIVTSSRPEPAAVLTETRDVDMV